MAYEVEDEVDWSDGTLDEPPSTSTGISGDSGYVSPAVHKDDGIDYLFEPQQEEEHDIPLGTAPPPGMTTIILMIRPLTMISTRTSNFDASTARAHRCASQPPSAFRAGLCSLRSLSSQSESLRVYLSQALRQPCFASFSNRAVLPGRH